MSSTQHAGSSSRLRRHSATTVSPFFFFSVIRQQRILGSRSANPSGSSIVPVRAGIVRRAWTYQWSSASFHTGRSHWDPLVKDQKLRGLARDWEDFLMRTPKTKDKTTRKMTRTGRPTGDFDFLSLVEQFKIFTFSQEETNERDIRRHFHPEAR